MIIIDWMSAQKNLSDSIISPEANSCLLQMIYTTFQEAVFWDKTDSTNILPWTSELN